MQKKRKKREELAAAAAAAAGVLHGNAIRHSAGDGHVGDDDLDSGGLIGGGGSGDGGDGGIRRDVPERRIPVLPIDLGLLAEQEIGTVCKSS